MFDLSIEMCDNSAACANFCKCNWTFIWQPFKRRSLR